MYEQCGQHHLPRESGLSTLESIQARGENWRGSPCYGRRKVVYAPDISKNQNGEKKFKKLSSKIEKVNRS